MSLDVYLTMPASQLGDIVDGTILWSAFLIGVALIGLGLAGVMGAGIALVAGSFSLALLKW